MAYTNPCAISGTIWDGPSGCPIVSPSNWQTYVLDNLCVLALHNHSGSSGEGATFSASFFPEIDVDQFSPFFPTASTNWFFGLGNWLLAGFISTSTNNAEISYPVYLRDGTYQLSFLSGCADTGGILITCLNGLSIPSGSWDLYKSGAETANVCAGVSFTTSGYGKRQLTFAISGSNINSVGYCARLGMISIYRIGT